MIWPVDMRVLLYQSGVPEDNENIKDMKNDSLLMVARYEQTHLKRIWIIWASRIPFSVFANRGVCNRVKGRLSLAAREAAMNPQSMRALQACNKYGNNKGLGDGREGEAE